MSGLVSALVGILIGLAITAPFLYWHHRRVTKRYVEEEAPVKVDLSEFTLDPKSNPPELEIYHRDGVDWLDAPIPPRWHTCQAQTFAWTNTFTAVSRCACGAIKIAPGRWGEKNSKNDEPIEPVEPEERPTVLEYIIVRVTKALREALR